MSEIYIDARISNYTGDPRRCIGTLFIEDDSFSVDEFINYIPAKSPHKGLSQEQILELDEMRRNTIIVVDNVVQFKQWDLVFSEVDHLNDAVNAYRNMKSMHAIELDTSIAAVDPMNIVEVRKIDKKGTVYELDSDQVTNDQMCLLVACWAANIAKNKHRMVAGIRDIAEKAKSSSGIFKPFTL